MTSLILQKRLKARREKASLVQRYMRKLITWKKYHSDFEFKREHSRVEAMKTHLVDEKKATYNLNAQKI